MELEARGADAEKTWWQGDSEKYMTCSSKGPAFFSTSQLFFKPGRLSSTLRALFCFLFNLISVFFSQFLRSSEKLRLKTTPPLFQELFRVIVKLVSLYICICLNFKYLILCTYILISIPIPKRQGLFFR